MAAFATARLAVFALAAGLTPALASAQTAAPAPSDARRLSDAERQAILDGNTSERAALARGEAPGAESIDRRIHGEAGVMIGSGGSHGIYGVADIPLGDRGVATLSFENSHFRYRR